MNKFTIDYRNISASETDFIKLHREKIARMRKKLTQVHENNKAT